eukprot:1158509-Pelagomonas_calceolata.AAC.7
MSTGHTGLCHRALLSPQHIAHHEWSSRHARLTLPYIPHARSNHLLQPTLMTIVLYTFCPHLPHPTLTPVTFHTHCPSPSTPHPHDLYLSHPLLVTFHSTPS